MASLCRSLLRNPLAGSIWYDTKQQRQPSLEQAKKNPKQVFEKQIGDQKTRNKLYVLCTTKVVKSWNECVSRKTKKTKKQFWTPLTESEKIMNLCRYVYKPTSAMLRPSRSFADCGTRSGDWRPFNNLFLSALTISVISLYFLFRHDKDVCEKRKP